MEKLKCSSCGGEIKVDENKEFGKCPYCGTEYKLNEDINLNIKMDDNVKDLFNSSLNPIKRMSKLMFIPLIIFIIVVSVIIFTFVKTGKGIDGSYDKESDISTFNFQFTGDNGTKNAFFMDDVLDDIIQSNKTHDRLVVLVYEGKEITDEKEIINIKHSLSGDYEVSLNYEDGYIYQVVVDKIK